MANKRNSLVETIVVVIIVIMGLFAKSYQDKNRPEHYFLFNRFEQLAYEDILSFNFYKVTGYDSYEEIVLDEVQKQTLYNSLMDYTLDVNTSSHYNSTRAYKLDIIYNDGVLWEIHIMPQNTDLIVVLFENDRYSPSKTLEWLLKNNL